MLNGVGGAPSGKLRNQSDGMSARAPEVLVSTGVCRRGPGIPDKSRRSARSEVVVEVMR